MVRLGLGYLEIAKTSIKSIYVSGGYASYTQEIKTETLVGESANTGFQRTLDLIASVKYSDIPAYLVLGSGNTPKSPNAPYLDNELMRYPRSASAIISVGPSTNDASVFIEVWWVRQHAYTLSPSSNLTIAEWGVSESGTSGSPLAAGGIFPSPIDLMAGETYVFKYRTLVYYTNDFLYTRSNPTGIDDVYQPYGDMRKHIPEFAEALLAGMNTYTYNGFVYDLVAQYSTYTPYATNATAYSPGSYKRRYTALVDFFQRHIHFKFISSSSEASPQYVPIAYSSFYGSYSTTTQVHLDIYWKPYNDF